MALRTDWSWKPDASTLKAILSGNNKVRRAARGGVSMSTEESFMATKKASKKAKKTAAKKGAKRKLDGKALAAKRKPRDSVAQFIKDELSAGRKDVDKIIEKAKADFPKAKPTRGYVRWIAKEMGLSKQVAAEPRVAKEKPAKAKAKAKKPKADKPDAPAPNPTAVDPAS